MRPNMSYHRDKVSCWCCGRSNLFILRPHCIWICICIWIFIDTLVIYCATISHYAELMLMLMTIACI